MGSTSEWLFTSEIVYLDPAVEAEWNKWFDEIHITGVLACPGFLSGTRYVSEDEDGNRHYLSIYELESPEALQSEPLQHIKGMGPFTEHVRSSGRLYRRWTPTAEVPATAD